MSGISGTKNYNELIQLQKERKKQAAKIKRKYNAYVKKHPFEPKSSTVQWIRQMYTGVEELKQTILNNHLNQKVRYWFDIKFGYILRNVENNETITYYPSWNTSYFDKEKPMINNNINVVLDQMEQDSIMEKLKRPNSKYSIERIYECDSNNTYS